MENVDDAMLDKFIDRAKTSLWTNRSIIAEIKVYKTMINPNDVNDDHQTHPNIHYLWLVEENKGNNSRN